MRGQRVLAIGLGVVRVGGYQALHNERPAMPSGVGYDMALPIVEALKAVGPNPGYLKESFERLAVKDADVEAQLRELKLVTQ